MTTETVTVDETAHGWPVVPQLRDDPFRPPAAYEQWREQAAVVEAELHSDQHPAEVDAVLTSHAGVSAAAVVGVSDERLGEVGTAFIIAKAGAHVEESELSALAQQRLANYKRLRRYVFVDSFPVNASGKILKHEPAASAAAAAGARS